MYRCMQYAVGLSHGLLSEFVNKKLDGKLLKWYINYYLSHSHSHVMRRPYKDIVEKTPLSGLQHSFCLTTSIITLWLKQ